MAPSNTLGAASLLNSAPNEFELATYSEGLVDKVPISVIASDRRERCNLCLAVCQRIEIAAAACADLAMTLLEVLQYSLNIGTPARHPNPVGVGA